MTGSFADYLPIVREGFPPGIISEQGLIPETAFTEAHRLVRLFPGALAFSPFGFECRLGSSKADADFSISLTTNNSGPDILAGNLPDNDFDPKLFRNPVWEKIRNFGKLWASPPSPLFQGIDDVCLGFDISTETSQLSLPNFSFSPFGPARNVDPDNQLDVKDVVNILESAYRCIEGYGPTMSMIRAWERCIRNLPTFDSLFHVAIMSSRPYADSLRLGVAFRSGNGLLQFLETMDWQGNIAEVGRIVKRIDRLFGSLRLLFDVNDGVLPRIGIECVFWERANPDREPLWSDFMAFLVGNRICHPAKKDLVFSFPGVSKNNPHDFPLAPQKMSKPLEMKYSSFFIRKIYHTKLVYGEDLEWTSKVYLGLVHAWKSCWGDILTGRGPWGIIG